MLEYIMYDLLTGLNIFSGIIITVTSIMFYVNVSGDRYKWKWIKLVYTAIGVGWTLYYLWVLLTQDISYTFVSSYMVVGRPLITLTLVTIAAGAILRAKSYGIFIRHQ